MTFKDVLAQVLEWLQHDQRLSYRALKRQFALDDDALEESERGAPLHARPRDRGRWSRVGLDGRPSPHLPPRLRPPYACQHPRPARPPRLWPTRPRISRKKSFTSRSVLEGERKQVTVLFADLKGSMELLADRDPEEARATPRSGAGTHDGRRASV